jgi:hypothetical protein
VSRTHQGEASVKTSSYINILGRDQDTNFMLPVNLLLYQNPGLIPNFGYEKFSKKMKKKKKNYDEDISFNSLNIYITNDQEYIKNNMFLRGRYGRDHLGKLLTSLSDC